MRLQSRNASSLLMRFILSIMALIIGLEATAVAQTSSGTQPRASWKALWIAHPTAQLREPSVFHFRKTVRLNSKPQHFRVLVSADNRFVLFVNGQWIGEGPARADLAHWRYETFDLASMLKPGENVIAALVWQHGIYAPLAQFSDRAAFMMEGESASEMAVTTDESWDVEQETGHTFLPRAANDFWEYTAVGPGDRIDGAKINWNWKESSSNQGRWVKAAPAIRESIYRTSSTASSSEVAFETSWGLVADPLPPMEHTLTPVGRVVRADLPSANAFPASPISIPADSKVTILLDRGSVTTAYPELTVSGGKGASVVLRFTEALYDEKNQRHDRNAVGSYKVLAPTYDEFLMDGSSNRTFSTLSWRTWRYLELSIKTGSDPLQLENMHAYFSAFPFVERAKFSSNDPALAKIWEICWRGARLGAHENYVDTPYWEQLQYIGDTRLQSLISYTVANDDRLARQALQAFDASRRSDGLTQSRYPSTLPQYIAPFSLLYLNMLHDYWMYRPDPSLVKELLPGTRATLQWFIQRQRADGFLAKLPYWRFIDTPIGVKGWPLSESGEWPPMDADGRSAVHTLQFVGALLAAAEMEESLGERHYAELYRAKAKLASDAVYNSCWNAKAGLIADTPEQKTYSQHANLYAVLFNVVPRERQAEIMRRILAPAVASYRAEGTPELARVSYFFTFYLARAMQHAGFGNDYLALLEPWREMPARGLTSTPEYPDPTRSDTHAWSAHPIYDMLTIVAGISPDAPGFTRVRIAPNLGPLKMADASMPHPSGLIETRYTVTSAGLQADITLPKGLQGTFVWKGREYPLREGKQTISAE